MITAQQAAIEAGSHQRALNSSRYTPPMPKIFKKASEENRLYIFNVGPWPHQRPMGSAGTFHIPPCPDGKEYAGPLTVEGIISEPYPNNETENKILQEDGEVFAANILGEGPNTPPNASFRPFGVFVSRNIRPTKEELSAAHSALTRKYVELVAQANAAAADGPQRIREVINPRYHYVAARALKKSVAECPWLANTETPAERAECPGCGDVYKVGILRHSCGWFFDKETWEANQAGKKGKG